MVPIQFSAQSPLLAAVVVGDICHQRLDKMAALAVVVLVKTKVLAVLGIPRL
jgi:hypothetical protein